MKTALVVLALAITVAVIGLVALAGAFSHQIVAREARLTSAPPEARRNDLPEAVHAFAERGLAGAAPARALHYRWQAAIRREKGGGWMELGATQVFAVAEPGFSWLAEARFGPVPAIRVVDWFETGDGALEIRFLGAVPMGREAGPAAALGEGMRYLAELPFVPDAIATNRAIDWHAVPDGLVAGMETQGGRAEVRFTLDAGGDIVGLSAKGRPARQPDGSLMPLDWRGSFGDYALIGGRRVPATAEIGYVYADGYEAYYRASVAGLTAVGK
ncbi:MAG: hypothetical protein KDK10_02065 [Maritimibacter sp.]|nr:hypothetical protein [Maritimibacter sp.]